MSRRDPAAVAAAVAVAVVGALLLSGCASQAEPPEDAFAADGDRGLPPSRVDVDTPQLRAVKRSARIAACPPSDPQAAPVDGGLPDVTLPCLGGGRPVHLAGLRGRPMVVNVWGYWCGPCREELPALQEFHERAGDEVLMLGVDYQDPQPGGALRLLRELGVTYPQVADFDKVIDRGLGRHPVPMTVLVDADGTVVEKLPLQIGSADQLAELVEESLGVRV